MEKWSVRQWAIFATAALAFVVGGSAVRYLELDMNGPAWIGIVVVPVVVVTVVSSKLLRWRS